MSDKTSPARRLLWVFPGFGVGGAQVRFAALANRFSATCSHCIVALNGDLACREKLAPGLETAFPDAGHEAGRMIPAIAHARHFLRAQNPDLVITSNWGAIEWAIGARLAGLPHIHTEDGFGPEERSRQIPRRVLTRRLALRGSRVILPSRTLHRIALDTWRLPAKNLSYIPNGIDLARFANATPAVLPPGKGMVIGTIAALRAEKNIGRLLRAFAVIRAERPVRLVIVGDGPERAGLERLAGDLGVAGDVVFAGYSTQAESWLACFDVFALSSDTEQMPLSLLEAMAAGRPVVSTDVGDVRAMLSAQNGDFVTASDDAPFAAGLRRLLAAPLTDIGAANRIKAHADYDQEAMFAGYARHFRIDLQ